MCKDELYAANGASLNFFFFLITLDVRANLRAFRLIPRGREVNDWVKPPMTLRGLELMTIGEQT